MLPACAQGMLCSSQSTCINSATAIAGWVSFRWHRHLFVQIRERAVLHHVAQQDVAHGGSDKEVLLTQTQLASGRRAVIRIEHP